MITFECDVCGAPFKNYRDSLPNSIIIESHTYMENTQLFHVPSITERKTFGLKKDLCPRCMNTVLGILYPKNKENMKSCENCIHQTVCSSYSCASEAFEITDPEKMANGCDDYIPSYNNYIPYNVIKGE